MDLEAWKKMIIRIVRECVPCRWGCLLPRLVLSVLAAVALICRLIFFRIMNIYLNLVNFLWASFKSSEHRKHFFMLLEFFWLTLFSKKADFNILSDKKYLWHDWSNLISKSVNYKGLAITPSMLLIKHSSETSDMCIPCVERILYHMRWEKQRNWEYFARDLLRELHD